MASNRGVFIAVGILLVLLLAMPLTMGWGPGMMGYGPWGHGMMWGYGGDTPGVPNPQWGFGVFFGGLMMVLFWAAAIGATVLIGRSLFGAQSAASSSPGDVLRQRYAAGEITKEQYEEAREVLRHE